MRLDIRYPDGRHDTVAVSSPVAIVGRDASCDIVVDHPRVSRRHAVIEQSPGGLFIRDTRSVNGVHLNGRRIERSALVVGDELRLGEVCLVLLDDAAGDTRLARLIEPELTVQAARPAPQDAPPPGGERPLTLSVLATVWLLVLPVAVVAGITFVLIPAASGERAWLGAAALLGVAVVAAALGFGTVMRQRWLPVAHLLLCAIALPTCLLTPLAMAAGMYLLHPRTRAYFRRLPHAGRIPNEAAFTTAILGSLAAALIVGVAFFSGAHVPSGLLSDPLWKPQSAVLRRLRAMYAAEESFRRVCNVGYADFDALRRPATVIPGFPPAGAPFVSEDLARAEAHGYRFELSVSDPMAPTGDCPTFRRFRGFRYVAAPLSGRGRFYLLQSDGIIHWSEHRPARPDDPALDSP